jgi:hypothetical protein
VSAVRTHYLNMESVNHFGVKLCGYLITLVRKKQPTVKEALKSLMICKSLNYYDYGIELAGYFNGLGLIDPDMMGYLVKLENWSKQRKPKSKAGKLLNFLPNSINLRLLNGLREILDIKEIPERSF